VTDATNPTIFVGANDGMVHAINKNTGKERWAYVPSMLISKMKNLSVDPYVHDYFVDGQITVGTIAPSGTNKRILVGGLGAGGRGMYALDITGSAGLTASSNANAASKVLWEITPSAVNYATPTNATDYANLGYTYGH
jgi:type IV pilus assembly protein PilY1